MADTRKTRGIRAVPDQLQDESLRPFLDDVHRLFRAVQDGSLGGGSGGSSGSGSSSTVYVPVPAPPSPSDPPDLTPPPTPSGLTAAAGITNVIIEWDAATFTVGHGPLQTNIYGATYAGTGPLPTFSNAVLVGVAPDPSAIFALATEPSTQWHLWIKFQTRDGVESVSPAGGANGLTVTTGQDVSLLLEALTGQITESQLYSTLGARIDLIDGSGVGSVNARIATETTARTSADTALSGQITTLTSTVNGNVAAISNETAARISADSVLTTNVTTLQSQMATNTAAISTEASTRASADGALQAQYTVKVDVNGYVSGFGLASTSNYAAPSSSFIVRADKFAISSPSGPGITPITPFIVNTTPTTENGVAIPAGVYMDGAYVRNLTAAIARLGSAWVDDAKIANLSASKLLAGSIGVEEYIQSPSYVSGSSGWRISGSGFAEFGAAAIRGQLAASQINTNGLTIRDNSGNLILGSGSGLNPAYLGTGASANLLYNPAFDNGTSGWTFTGSYLIPLSAWGINIDSSWRLAPASAPNTSVFWARQDGTVGNQTSYFEFSGSQFPVEGGRRYMLSAYTGAHRCNVATFLRIYDTNGGLLQDGVAWAANDAEKNGGTALSGYKRQFGSVVASGAAAYAIPFIRKYDTYAGQTDSYVFATRLQAERVSDYASEPGPWVDSGILDATSVRSSNPITASNVTTYISSAAIGSLQIANVLQSDNYNPGTAGWAIRKSDGFAEFGAASIRGRLSAGNIVGASFGAGGLAISTLTVSGGQVSNGTLVSVSDFTFDIDGTASPPFSCDFHGTVFTTTNASFSGGSQNYKITLEARIYAQLWNGSSWITAGSSELSYYSMPILLTGSEQFRIPLALKTPFYIVPNTYTKARAVVEVFSLRFNQLFVNGGAVKTDAMGVASIEGEFAWLQTPN